VTADVFLRGLLIRPETREPLCRPPELKFRLHTQHPQFTVGNVDYAGPRSRVANPINSEFERSLRIDTPNLLTSLLKELKESWLKYARASAHVESRALKLCCPDQLRARGIVRREARNSVPRQDARAALP
jgi:hypothetical protein